MLKESWKQIIRVYYSFYCSNTLYLHWNNDKCKHPIVLWNKGMLSNRTHVLEYDEARRGLPKVTDCRFVGKGAWVRLWGKPKIRMLWGSHMKVRCTECVISGRQCSSHYLPPDKRAAHWPRMLTNGEENSALRCKFPTQVPHEYLVSRIQASDLENKVPPQSKWQAELVSC